MQSITIQSTLDAPADVIWRAVQRPEAFVHVAGAMLRYPVAERHQGPWMVGDRTVGWLFLGRVFPISRHTIEVVLVDHEERTLLTEEYGGMVRRWRHRITAQPLSAGSCRYVDRVDIQAGPLTPIVAAFAQVFYRYRQRRWWRLARILGASCYEGACRETTAGTQVAGGSSRTASAP